MRREERKAFWCDCPKGPRPARGKAKGPFVAEFAVQPPWDFGWGNDASTGPGVTLKDCTRLTYTFWKPIVIPIDFTTEVPAK